MTQEQKLKLMPYFAFVKSKEIAPEKYAENDPQKWYKILAANTKDQNTIAELAKQTPDDEWVKIAREYEAMSGQTIVDDEEEVPVSTDDTDHFESYAKNGAKLERLKELQSMKKGAKVVSNCSCGCAMVESKGEGGSMVSKCACNCKGGEVKGAASKVSSMKNKLTKKK